MVDCGECVYLGNDVGVRRAPSEVEGDSPSEVVVCAPLEEMRVVFLCPEEGAEEGWVVFVQHVVGSVQLVSRSCG